MTDGETITIDLYEDPAFNLAISDGASSSFVTDQLLPVLFSHDVEFRYEVVGDKNDNTRHFYNVPFYYFYNLLASGSPFNCYLPESLFMFNYTPSMNVEYPEDNVYGTEPDIYIPFTVDECMRRAELRGEGVDYYSYESRLGWDQTLIAAVEMADNS